MTTPLDQVIVPQSLFADPDLKPAVLQSWIRLRALAGESGLIPACTLKELAWRIGKSKSTLHTHLSLLRLLGCLDFSWPANGLWAISFVPLEAARQPREQVAPSAQAAAAQAGSAPPSSEIPDANRANDALFFPSPLLTERLREALRRAPTSRFSDFRPNIRMRPE